MARIAVVDPLLLTPGHGLDSGRLGPRHELVPAVGLTAQSLGEALRDVEVVLTAVAPVTAELMAAAPALRMVAKPGAGVDNIDVAEATRRGILVANAPGVRGQAVAEYVVFSTLHLLREAWRPAAERPVLAQDVAGRTLGLVGLGDIGARVARAGAALGADVVACTPSRRNPSPDVPVRFGSLTDVVTTADVLVLCMPLTSATRGLVDAAALARMRSGALLVNVARGPCVVTADLERALRDGHLRGAALDVTDPEPLPADHGLRALPNVLITPHVAGRSVRAQRLALDVLVQNVRGLLDGDGPLHVVNAEAAG